MAFPRLTQFIKSCPNKRRFLIFLLLVLLLILVSLTSILYLALVVPQHKCIVDKHPLIKLPAIWRNVSWSKLKGESELRATVRLNSTSPPQIKIFYHISAHYNTPDIVRDQLNKIIFSALFGVTHQVYCFLSGEEFYIKEIIPLIEEYGPKFSIERACADDEINERFTLLRIKNLINPNDKFLFIHTKGVGKPQDNKKNENFWRMHMEYFLIAQGLDCIRLLDRFDVVGVDLILGETSPNYFSGNFWWSTAAYYQTLSDTMGEWYLNPELHLFTKKPSFLSVHQSGMHSGSGEDLLYFSSSYHPKKFLGTKVDLNITAKGSQG